MGVELIPNQPFVFDQTSNNCNNVDQRSYCQLVNNQDLIYVQFKQTPCGDDVIVNGDFQVTPGSEMLLNPGFTGNANNWFLSGGWTYNSNKIQILGVHASGIFGQNVASLVAGRVYQVQITISGNVGSGTLQLDLGGQLNTGTFSGDGTYTLYANAGGSGAIQFYSITDDAADEIYVDNVSLKEAWGTDWVVDNEFYNNVSEGMICHIPGGVSEWTQTGVLVDQTYYKVTVTLTGRTQGSIKIAMGAIESEDITGNGAQSVYMEADGTNIKIVMDSDFDGCITSIDVEPLRTDFQFELFDLDGIHIASLRSPFTSLFDTYYNNEYVTLAGSISQGELQMLAGGFVPYGCYKIGIVNKCLEYACDCSFNEDDCSHDWVLQPEAEITGGQMVVTMTPTAGKVVATKTIALEDGVCYRLCWKVPTFTFPSATVTVRIGDYFKEFFNGGSFPSEGCEEFTANGATQITIDGVITVGGDMAFDYLCIYKCFNHLSNCLNWQESHECTKLLTGESDQDYSLGFCFTNDNFKLSNRLRVLAITPSYPDEEENYLFSSGSREITFAQSEKYWTYLFDYVDEVTHDFIRTVIITDHFDIDAVEHYVKKGYKIEWDKEGRFKLAQSTIEAKIKSQTITNSST